MDGGGARAKELNPPPSLGRRSCLWCLSGGGHSLVSDFVWKHGYGVLHLGAVGPSPALNFYVIPLSLVTFLPLSKSTLLGLFRKMVWVSCQCYNNAVYKV